MTVDALYHAAFALAAGVAGQAFAMRLGVPSIVVLLVTGVTLGPDVLGLLDPGALGAGRGALVTLGVTVILFEGGLGLDAGRLRQQQRSLVLLLTLGAAISMLGGALAARWALGMDWPIAALFGATMIVTGPTVVTPLLARLTVARPVRELLVSEGVLIDPVGAVVAIVTLEYVAGGLALVESGWLVLARLGIGAAVGVAAGRLLAAVLHRRLIPDDLVNPAVLSTVLLVAVATSRISQEAGLMAAVIQGVTLANPGVPELRRLREFKEALTLILLSFLFVTLAADLRLAEIQAIGWAGLVVVAVLVWVARPVAVALATAGSALGWGERAFVAWICPRGIVAAAVAGLFHILLDQAGIPGGAQLEALVFVSIAATVVVQGLTARRVARLLRIDVPSEVGIIVIGAGDIGLLLQRLLVVLERQVVVVDRNGALCRRARAEGLAVYEGDAVMVETLEEAGARYADTVVALTRNPELNTVVGQLVRDNFRVARVLALAERPEPGAPAAEDAPLPGDFPGVDEANRTLRLGRMRLFRYAGAGREAVGHRLAELPYGEGEFALVLERGRGVVVATADQVLAEEDNLWCASAGQEASPLAALFAAAHETDPRKPTRPAPGAVQPGSPSPTTRPCATE